MSENMEIRTFAPSDTDVVSGLIVRTIRRCYEGVFPGSVVRYFLGVHSPGNIARDAHEGVTSVLEVNGQVLATGTLKGNEIKRVFVDPDHQREGLGRRVMAELERYAIESGVGAVVLFASSVSLSFYEQLGYTQANDSPRHLTMEQDGARLVFHRMTKSPQSQHGD